jgi:hypothetical protein
MRPAGAVALTLVVAGLVLGVTVHMGFLLLFALGAFGPGALRELGLLADTDEFQRDTARRAAYRSFLVTGTLLAASIVASSWGALNFDRDAVPAHLVLALLLVVYLMSYLFSYWGARDAAFRLLVTFGLFWLAFVALSHAAEPLVLLIEGGVVCAPLFALAFASRRWPRLSGTLLCALGIAAFFFFGLYEAFREGTGAAAVILLLIVPVVGSGVALLVAGREWSESSGAD